ncbi:MAG: phage tail tube protein [Sporomusa sp.]
MHIRSRLDFKNTGTDVYFEIQVSDEDPTSAVGRQTMVFVDCNIDGGVLAKFDADGEYLNEDVDGTFEDFKMPEKFKLLSGML